MHASVMRAWGTQDAYDVCHGGSNVAHNLVVPAEKEPATQNCPFSVTPRGLRRWITVGMQALRDCPGCLAAGSTLL